MNCGGETPDVSETLLVGGARLEKPPVPVYQWKSVFREISENQCEAEMAEHFYLDESDLFPHDKPPPTGHSRTVKNRPCGSCDPPSPHHLHPPPAVYHRDPAGSSPSPPGGCPRPPSAASLQKQRTGPGVKIAVLHTASCPASCSAPWCRFTHCHVCFC